MRFTTRRSRITFAVVLGPTMIAVTGLIGLIGNDDRGWTEFWKVALGSLVIYTALVGGVGVVAGWWRRSDRHPPTR